MTVHEMREEIAARQGSALPILGLVGNVNHIVQRIRDKGDWSFFHALGVINLEDAYSTGTIAVTNGSTTVTGTGTTFLSTHVGWKLRGDRGEEYVIAACVSGTELTLDAAWVGETESGLTYILYKDTYLLPANFDRMMRMWDQTNNTELNPVVPNTTFRYAALSNQPMTYARRFSVYGYNSGLTQRNVVFTPAPDTAARIVYTYYKKPTEVTGPSSSPDLPADMHLIVLQGVVARTLKQNRDWESYRDAWAEFEKMLRERWAQDGAMRNIVFKIGSSTSLFTDSTIIEADSTAFLLTELGEIMMGGGGVGGLMVD